MTDENNTPIEDEVKSTPAETVSEHPPEEPVQEAPVQETPEQEEAVSDADPDMSERLERLGGEPAPVITPEEFARLQKAGQVHIDARGRVRTSRRTDAEAGVSLRKRRAWY